ncbi:hypothetical protein GOP47_0026566 [Adiantum capillus-veneris]|nr:hypothetical protein GOP47_0026566 [Adiantum capillus-veneris]
MAAPTARRGNWWACNFIGGLQMEQSVCYAAMIKRFPGGNSLLYKKWDCSTWFARVDLKGSHVWLWGGSWMHYKSGWLNCSLLGLIFKEVNLGFNLCLVLST